MGKFKDGMTKVKSMWSTPPKGRFLCIKEIGALGLYAVGTSTFYNLMLFYLVTIIFIPYFYKIQSIHAYVILILGNALNMLLQPVIGNAMEKTNTKLGRYKPYILGMLPFLVVFTVLATWIPQGYGETSRIIYAYCTCVPSILLTSFAYNMYQTMPTVITPNGQERADVMTPIGLIFGLAPTILQLIIGPIRSAFTGKEYWSMRLLGIIGAVIGLIGMLFVLRLNERVVTVTVENEDAKLKMKDALKMLSKNKPLIIMSVALCLGSLREFWRFFLQFFGQTRFASDVNMALNVMGIPMTIMGLGATVGMLLLPILTRKLNKNIVMIIFASTNFLACLILGVVGFQRIPVGVASTATITVLLLVASLANSIIVMLPMLIGDIADYQQSISGKRLEGHIQNFMLTIPLLFSQIIMLGLSFWQNHIGFEPMDYNIDTMPRLENGSLLPYTANQQLVACNWFNIVCVVSAVSTALMMIVLFFYPLSKKKHEECVEKIATMSGNSQNGENQNEVLLDGTSVLEGELGEFEVEMLKNADILASFEETDNATNLETSENVDKAKNTENIENIENAKNVDDAENLEDEPEK